MHDVESELKLLENSLRDFIEFLLRQRYGSEWMDYLKVSPERREAWSNRQDTERKRLIGEALEDRILYYSDFYDLRSIITKHWDDGFAEAFKEKKQLKYFSPKWKNYEILMLIDVSLKSIKSISFLEYLERYGQG